MVVKEPNKLPCNLVCDRKPPAHSKDLPMIEEIFRVVVLNDIKWSNLLNILNTSVFSNTGCFHHTFFMFSMEVRWFSELFAGVLEGRLSS